MGEVSLRLGRQSTEILKDREPLHGIDTIWHVESVRKNEACVAGVVSGAEASLVAGAEVYVETGTDEKLTAGGSMTTREVGILLFILVIVVWWLLTVIYEDRMSDAIDTAVDRASLTIRRWRSMKPEDEHRAVRASDTRLEQRTPRSWYPNRHQWRVMWIAYAVVFFINIEKMDLSGYTSNNPEEVVTAFVAVGAALLVWRLSRGRADRG